MPIDILIIKDPEVAKLFADETRRQILHSLRHHEFSATDLAKALEKSHSSIMHHLKLLQDAGLVEETRTEKKRNLVQTYYRSTAGKFIISYSLSESLRSAEFLTWHKEMLNKIAEGLSAFGIEIQSGEKERILELMGTCVLLEQKAFEGVIERQVKPLNIERPAIAAIIRLLTQLRLSQDKEHSRMVEELDKHLGYNSKPEAGDEP